MIEFIFVLAANLAAAPAPVPSQLPAVEEGREWRLVWHDEFEGPTLDETRWERIGDSPRRDGFWVKDDAYLDGKGCLVLRTRKDGQRYTSGAVRTRGKFEHTGGFWEARCKFHKQPGHWPAFWLMPAKGLKNEELGGAAGAEIDIMEKAWLTEKINHAVHWDGYGEHHKAEAHEVETPGLNEGFHTFALWWTPERYVFYVDGQETWRTNAGGASKVPSYAKLTEEIGPWAGDIAEAALPDYFVVDYVRVYDLVDSAGEAVSERNEPSAAATLPQSDRPLRERFADPPAEARILKIVHRLPDSPQDQDRLFESLIGQGFGGIVTNVSFTDYMQSEEKWEALVRGVQEAKCLGMALWLYDEHGYPSCKAGGLTLQNHPEWQAQGLYVADAESRGGAVEMDVPPGELLRASAFPVKAGEIQLKEAVDLTDRIAGQRLSWNAPESSWHVIVITRSYLHEGTHADGNLSDSLPYPNLLMPEPTARFIELTHAQYAKRLGDDLGHWFISTFTDEPSLMSLFLKRQPWRVLPWAPNLPAEFERRRGYDLDPFIPALVADAGGKGRAVRYDFWLTVGELVSENYFGQIQTWCRAHNTLSGGHLLLEEPLLAHVPLYGDFFRCIRRLSAPSIDCLTSIPAEAPWFVARLISSAAELEGRGVTMSETSDHSQRYRPEGDNRPVRVVSEAEIRGTCNRLILNGITTITSYYSFAGLSPEAMVRLNEYIGRCCTMLKGGHQVAGIAMLYPAESVWTRFEPSRRFTENCPQDAQRIQSVYRLAGNALFEARRDFTYVDGRALKEATVENGVLRHKNLEWRVVVLPCVDTLTLAAWQNLAEFWRTGGAVVALTRLPANSEKEFPSPAVQALAKEVFDTEEGPSCAINEAGGAAVFLPPGSESLLPAVVDSLLGQDVWVADQDAPIRVTHRRIDGQEVYFLVNDSGEPWAGTVSFAASGGGEQWDPATGTIRRLDAPAGVTVSLEPFGGMLFRFAKARLPERKRAENGLLPELEMAALPQAEPTAGMGEFVEGGVEKESGGGWKSSARITKSDVDTHLFVSFSYEIPLDLRGAACIVLDTAVPEGQTVPTPLRVIVRDVHGAEYIADTTRPLGSPGKARSFVPLSQFDRAGWSQASKGDFDWSAIAAIRVGWGGYTGAEGETVVFTISEIELARVTHTGEKQ